MYKDMTWLADMAKGFRQAAGIIDEIVETQLTIEARGKATKRDAKSLQDLIEMYEKILIREKKCG